MKINTRICTTVHPFNFVIFFEAGAKMKGRLTGKACSILIDMVQVRSEPKLEQLLKQETPTQTRVEGQAKLNGTAPFTNQGRWISTTACTRSTEIQGKRKHLETWNRHLYLNASMCVRVTKS